MVSWGAVESGRISLARVLSLSNMYRVCDTCGTYRWADNSADCIGSCLDDMSLAVVAEEKRMSGRYTDPDHVLIFEYIPVRRCMLFRGVILCSLLPPSVYRQL